jgi:RND family efflux transporter MFP subunit
MGRKGGIDFMKRLVLGSLLLVILAGAFQAGSHYSSRAAVHTAAPEGTRKILYYVDPMNPAHTSDAPGIAPCGMKMEPVYADEGPAGQAPAGGPAAMPPGIANVSLAKQQIVGVRVGAVEMAAGTHTLRLLGRVVPDETRVYRLNAGIDGFIREVSAVTTGDPVMKGQVLAAFSAPSSINVIQTYILNLGAEDRARQAAAERSVEAQAAPLAAANIQQRVDQLQNMGMSRLQIEEIKFVREVPQGIKIVAPADGFVISRSVSPGQVFDRGTEFYQIADLSRVWVLADVTASEAMHVRPGMSARVAPPRRGQSFAAEVTPALPQPDRTAAGLKVRLEADNPGFALRPDMLVDVEIPVSLPSALTVPEDAVLDSGLAQTVFVDRGNGFFEPRPVETGRRLGGRVEIVKGLMEGERIVVSGNFLIDSESRMQLAAAGMPAAVPMFTAELRARDPVCGMEVDADKAKAAGLASEHGGTTYYFCMADCKLKFEANPGAYLSPPAGGRPAQAPPHAHGQHAPAHQHPVAAPAK